MVVDDIGKVIDFVAEMNYRWEQAHNDGEVICEYRSAGTAELVTLFGMIIWCSEDDQRECDESGFEDMSDFLRRKSAAVIGKIFRLGEDLIDSEEAEKALDDGEVTVLFDPSDTLINNLKRITEALED